ncbi:unnamed protein product [Urochloa humidicola]
MCRPDHKRLRRDKKTRASKNPSLASQQGSPGQNYRSAPHHLTISSPHLPDGDSPRARPPPPPRCCRLLFPGQRSRFICDILK